ncbi:hypothetical protein E2C01_019960 [Portunus trituberculatus]|uniref:Uncharacterized protein n=1 Tax=Portunus trituberculatus TaxID=210409 RepID=A0A5B7DYZ2_PORTR|nr:hypothetical protein [Portunus trituberculatus]
MLSWQPLDAAVTACTVTRPCCPAVGRCWDTAGTPPRHRRPSADPATVILHVTASVASTRGTPLLSYPSKYTPSPDAHERFINLASSSMLCQTQSRREQ